MLKTNAIGYAAIKKRCENTNTTEVLEITETEVEFVNQFPVTEVKELHAASRGKLLNKLERMSKQNLMSQFIVEMDAKNEAYYFILEHGHLQSFHSYCFPWKK